MAINHDAVQEKIGAAQPYRKGSAYTQGHDYSASRAAEATSPVFVGSFISSIVDLKSRTHDGSSLRYE